jgi:4-amino-4-deoxy-L-arabinose transferase-like glycosyltransferase
MKRLGAAAVMIGLAAYAVAFYATPLPSVRGDAGPPLLRIELLAQLLLRPDEWLFPNWFGTPWQCSLLDRLPVLLVAGAILAWALVLGWLLIAVCGGNRGLGRLELAVFSTAVGLNALSTWVLLLGLFGVMNRLWVFTLPVLSTLGLARHLWRNSNPATVNCRAPRLACPTAPSALRDKPAVAPSYSDVYLSAHWLWLAAPFVLAILLAAMLPPLDFDVREYHLQAPKEFFEQGQITFLPHNVYANMTLGTEMLSLLAMVLSGDWWLGALAGKTVIAGFTLLCGLGLWAAGRRLFSPTAGVVAALVYLSIPWVTSIASGGFVEGASACYLFLALYAWLLHREQGTPSLLLAGYLAGGAVSTKYPALLFVLLPLAAAVLIGQRRAKAARACGVFLLAAAVGCGPWFAKNWVLTSNPTYPLLYDVFDGKTWSAEKDRQWGRVHRPHDFSAAMLAKDLGRIALTSEWLSPLVVPLAALAFVGWRVRRGGRSRPAGKDRSVAPAAVVWLLLAYVGFVIAVWWLLTHRIDRFWIPVLPVLALLAGAGGCWIAERWWRRVLVAVLLAAAGANFLVASAGQGNAWFVSLARLRDQPGWIDPWHEYFNVHLSRGRLLAVGDAAVFDLVPPVLYNTCFDDCIFEQIVRGRTAAEIRAELAARQVAYIYVDWGEIARYRHSYGFTDFVQPAVFTRLVEEGILEPLPPLEGHAGRGYRVKGGT